MKPRLQPHRVPLRVGMFTYSTAPRGSVVHAAALAEALVHQGCDVTLYALSKVGEPFYRDVACRLALVPAAKTARPGQALVRQRIGDVRSFLAERVPAHEVFHAQDCLTANALLEGGVARGRVFRTVHHVEHFDCPYLHTCQERSIVDADALFAVSRKTALEVSARFGRESLVVGNGVNANHLADVSPADVVSMRSELLAGRQGPLLLSVGGVEPRKNSQRTLEAFALIKERYPNAVWAIVGGATALDHAQYVAAFEASLAQKAWRHDVVRCGVLTEPKLRASLGASDVLLNASVQEGFGLTVLEALAAGLPAVVSEGAPFDEFLRPGSAFRADPTGARSIADAAQLALSAPMALQAEARRVALAHAWKGVAERTFDAYTRLLPVFGTSYRINPGVRYA